MAEEGGEQKYEEYEVELVQPFGLKFAKGPDGGTYIDAIAAGGSADKSGMFTVGDKVLATRFCFCFSISFPLNFMVYCIICILTLMFAN